MPILFSPARLHSTLRRLVRPTLLAAALLGVQAGAQTFGFTPTILNIDSTRNLVAETTMLNSTATPARFTVEAKVWKIVDGQAVLEETRDLIVNPATFTVAPGATQLIRVGVRKKPGNSELSYRIVVRQEAIEGVPLPKVNSSFGEGRSAAMNVSVVFSLPIYVTPPAARAQVAFKAAAQGSDVVLTVQNTGTRRAVYRNVLLTRGGITQSAQVIAALAGSSQTFTLRGLATQGGPLTLKYVNEDGKTLVETIPAP
ncbi:molecular chaperone [Deinococcus navajonensis]|uniref:Molecular chaperone n=1 Tax=Deinococcus navajonensis TaxID=309884 RepID=A0ABV8XKC1_9DEIO